MIQFLLWLFFSSAFADTGYSCDTTYDQLNIPHVKTTSEREFYYCFGYHHGKDRAWQMDYFRRVAQGRNAEILGFAHLKSDLMMRLLDLPALAKRIWSNLPENKKDLLLAYARGANHGFETGKETEEFQDKDYEPEPWEGQHSIMVLLLQSFDQTRKTFTRDYDEEILKEQFGSKAQELFDEDQAPWENTILKKGEYRIKSENSKQTSYRVHKKLNLWADFPHLFGKESGSNNWVISKKKSRTGHAILANDPHLDLKTPLFWYWISLQSPGSGVIGASVPGVPVVASGTNGKVAWGLTNSYLDSADAVVLNDLKSEDIETFRPVVYVKLGFLKVPFFFKSFEKLKTGQKILPLELKSDQKIVLRWTGYDLGANEISPMFNLFHVENVKDMDRLLSSIGIPSWNYVFADQKGEIGYRLVGKTYRHTQKLPMGIPVMTTSEFLNPFYLSESERPHLINPERQYVYSANNRHWPSDAYFYGGRGYSYSFRGLRIEELLEGQHDEKSFQEIQCDRQVVDSRFFLPLLRKLVDEPMFSEVPLTAHDDSKVLPVYRRLMDITMERWKVNEYALIKILRKPDKARLSDLKKFHAEARKEAGNRTWGEMLRVSFPHLSKNEKWKFAPELPGSGDVHSVDPGTSRWNPEKKQYEHYSGASMRMIIHLSPSPRILLALPGVNRGYQSKQEDSQWSKWKNCQYSEVKM